MMEFPHFVLRKTGRVVSELQIRLVAGAVTAFILAMLYIGLFIAFGWPKPQCRRCANESTAATWRQR
jgi:hypothetical protein